MSERVVKVERIRKTFRVGFWRKRVEAVREASFSVRRGEIVGLIGPNGAGKTTAMKMMMGLVTPDAGSVEMFGASAHDVRSRTRLGYLPEGPYFYEHLKPQELLKFYGQLFGLGGKELERRGDELLELVGLSHAKDRPIRKFSKGMRQRVGIAQALINDPELVILDEPQTGLDPTGRKEVRDLIAHLRDDGKTIMFSSHILPDVEAVCDRVIVMSQGRVVDEGALSDLTGDQISGWEVVVRAPHPVEHELALQVEPRGEATLLRFAGELDVAKVVAELTAQPDTDLLSVNPERMDLEQIYLRET